MNCLREGIDDMAEKEYPRLQYVFGGKVRELRETMGLSREELAERAEYSPQNLAKIEAGERFVTADALERLAKVLKAPPEEFFAASDKTPVGKSPVRKKLDKLLDRQDERRLEMIFDVVSRVLKEM